MRSSSPPKIVVCVKRVAELDDGIELIDGQPDASGLEWSLNQWDGCALEAALHLCEQVDGGEIVALSVGGDEVEGVLRECLASGAHRALRVWDEVLADVDPLGIARVLAAVVEREAPDLVLAGVQSSDMVNGATGAALAGHLGLPYVAAVRSIESGGDELRVKRELEGGTMEVLRVTSPAVLTVQKGGYVPRIATLRAIKLARNKRVDELGLSDVGIDAAQVQASAGARLRGLGRPPAGQRATMFDGDAAEIANRIVELVRERVAR